MAFDKSYSVGVVLLLYPDGIEEDVYAVLKSFWINCRLFRYAATTVLAKHGGNGTNHGVYI